MIALPWWLPLGSVPEIDADDLAASMARGGAPELLDVRTTREWQRAHIAGSINVPVHELPTRLSALQLDRDRPVVAICLSAHRSVVAVRLMLRRGFRDVRQLRGGMLAWRRRGLAEVRSA